jgi:regulator of protease activity HflC (stomatin/prohibitin superfamily)
MLLAIIAVLLIAVGVILTLVKIRYPKQGSSPTAGRPKTEDLIKSLMGPVLLGIGLVIAMSRSFVIIGPDEVGHLTKIYFGANLKSGAIIAANGEKGPQARTLPPGFHLIPLVKVIYDIRKVPWIEIQEGNYGLLVARDGKSLRQGQFLADAWSEEQFDDMLDAEYFLNNGGQKGPQLSVLKPGRYRLNQFLFAIKEMPAVDVPAGRVAVIRSNVQSRSDCPNFLTVSDGKRDDQVAVPIVPKGCIGVWNEPLPPGRYYLNQKAFVPTLIPTRIQTWVYKGGYTKRRIDLEIGDDGKILQREFSQEVPVPKHAADGAINVRVQGWTVPVEMRVVVQVHPQDAPTVVASVGNLEQVENKIVTPAIRDILRTIGGGQDCQMVAGKKVCQERRVLDFIENRETLTAQVEVAVAHEARKAGVTTQEIRMGEPAIPPELMVARLRKQLADQLQETYAREQIAQKERIKVERERATANQQQILVKAEIEKQAAEFKKERARLEGEGEKLRLIEIAEGQKAMTQVLGEDRTLQLQMLKEMLSIAKDNPDIIKVPMVQVLGSGGASLEGAAAVLGASNFGQMVQNRSANSQSSKPTDRRETPSSASRN